MDNAGHLCITAKPSVEDKRSIPIDFKPSDKSDAAKTPAAGQTPASGQPKTK
jgi:hypothetical protein